MTYIGQGDDSVIVETEAGESWRAPYAVLASGAASALPRTLGIGSDRPIPTLIRVRSPELLQRLRGRPIFTFGLVSGGYFWLFPKGDHFSAGIFSVRKTPDLREPLRQALEHWGLPASEAVIRSYPIPLYRAGRPWRAGRVLLVGDAASLVDPFLGEGIRHAMISGRLAAQVLLAGQAETYSAQVEATIGRLLRGARLMAILAYTFPRLAAWLLGTRAALSAGFGRFFQGQCGYNNLLWRLPLYLLGLPHKDKNNPPVI